MRFSAEHNVQRVFEQLAPAAEQGEERQKAHAAVLQHRFVKQHRDAADLGLERVVREQQNGLSLQAVFEGLHILKQRGALRYFVPAVQLAKVKIIWRRKRVRRRFAVQAECEIDLVPCAVRRPYRVPRVRAPICTGVAFAANVPRQNAKVRQNHHGKRGDCLAHALPCLQKPHSGVVARSTGLFVDEKAFQPALISRNHLKKVGVFRQTALYALRNIRRNAPQVVHLFAGAHVPRVDRHGQRSLCKVVHVARVCFQHLRTRKR